MHKQVGKLPGLYENFLILSILWDQVRLEMSPGAPQLCLPPMDAFPFAPRRQWELGN